jgi:acetolactate synthase-1/2/3 large subunit
MESPRGVNDPSLGAFAEVLPRADLVLLLGRRLDFGLQLGKALGPDCRVIHLDPDADAIEQTRRALDDGPRLVAAETADPVSAARRLARLAGGAKSASTGWYDEVNSAVSYRPPEWREIESGRGDGLHPVEVGRAVQEVLDRADEAVFISDGGEFGQWAQACVSAPTRLINGPAGSIGTSVPYALAARARFPEATVITMLGDGTMGFHMSEFDTAVRHGLPFVAVVGNDAAWNAEYQIQLREYGEDRLWGCELLPSRYDEVVRALGGHGEYVDAASGLGPALERAVASGLPACVNVAIGRHAAPVIRRQE